MQLTLPVLLAFLFHVHTVITTKFTFHCKVARFREHAEWFVALRCILSSPLVVYCLSSRTGCPECQILSSLILWRLRENWCLKWQVTLMPGIHSVCCNFILIVFFILLFLRRYWYLSYVVWNLNQSYSVLLQLCFPAFKLIHLPPPPPCCVCAIIRFCDLLKIYPCGSLSQRCTNSGWRNFCTVAPDICGFSVWSLLLDVTLQAPRIFRSPIDFWKICGPLH
jgi:hypothetical protein